MFSIFSRNNCIWCSRAKELLYQQNLKYVEYNIEEKPLLITQFKAQWPGRKTVPAISFYDNPMNVYQIGGYEDLVKWLKHYTNT